MQQLRSFIPFLGVIALIAIFLRMPETPNFFGLFKCKMCLSRDPYLPLLGGGYFATLIAVSLLFPTLPSQVIARIGMVWAIVIAILLTYIDLPNVCAVCLIAHMCNIFIWAIWCVTFTEPLEERASPFRERFFFTLFSPILVIALLGCLNLTFMIYNLRTKHTILTAKDKSSDDLMLGNPSYRFVNIPAFKFVAEPVNKNLPELFDVSGYSTIVQSDSDM